MQADRPHRPRPVGIDIDDDPAAAQRRPQRGAARAHQQREIGGRHRQRQYVAIIKRRAHRAWSALFAVDSAARASARRSAITLLSAALVAFSAGQVRLSVIPVGRAILPRSEEHTSELQSLMRISYAV